MSVISRSTSPSETSIFSFSSDFDRPAEYRIHVAFLPFHFSEHRLRKLFERFGVVLDVWVASASTFGFVVFKRKEDAQFAIEEMDRKIFKSHRLKVTWARPRTRNPLPRNDSSTRCYKCGLPGHFSRECETRKISRRSRFRSPQNRFHPDVSFCCRPVEFFSDHVEFCRTCEIRSTHSPIFSHCYHR